MEFRIVLDEFPASFEEQQVRLGRGIYNPYVTMIAMSGRRRQREMNLSRAAEKELIDLAGSDNFNKDLDTLRVGWANAFVKDGEVDAGAYIEFLNHFNEFISHEPKTFAPMIEKEMKL